MNILFLTIGLPDMAKGNGFYADLIQELISRGNNVTAIAPALQGQSTGLYQEGNTTVLRVQTMGFVGNYSTIKKVIGVVLMNPNYKRAYKSYLRNAKFDWVIMPTPPASLIEVAKCVVKQTGAKLYLLLRDIHPESRVRIPDSKVLGRTDVYEECKKPYVQNAIIRKSLYRHAQNGYKKADIIGCMSQTNIDFVKKIAPYVCDSCLTVLPNWYKEPDNHTIFDESIIRKKYNLENKTIVIYGGNVTVAQAVWNFATLAKHNINKKDVVFMIIGRGDGISTLKDMVERDNLTNVTILDYMPREDYEQILQTADIGLISIDEKYKVPTCPSKIIGYMALKKPVLAMFNEGSDYGDYYMGGNVCGLWSTGLDNEKMFANFDWLYSHPEERKRMGEAGYEYYKKNFDVKVVAEELCKQLKNG